MKNRTVMLWCREPGWCSGFSSLYIGDAVTLVPVFCFDPRESKFFPEESSFNSWKRQLVADLKNLRKELRLKGSDLLITNGLTENMIPSFARVLKVDEVITCKQSNHDIRVSADYDSFQKDLISATSFQLKMHSIHFTLTDEGVQFAPPLKNLPSFPGINPGSFQSAQII